MNIVQLATTVLDGVRDSFSLKAGVTKREIRMNGAICVAVGFALFFVAGGLLFAMPSDPRVAMLPVLGAYALWIVGGYRLVFAASEDSTNSLVRVLFGVVFIAAIVGLPIACSIALESLGVFK
jgi:hypothetical protein